MRKYNNLHFLDVDDLIEIRTKIKEMNPSTDVDKRNQKILYLYFVDRLSSNEIAVQFEISKRMVNNIVKQYFPEYMLKRSKSKTIKSSLRNKTNNETTKLKKEFCFQKCCKCGSDIDIELHHMIPHAFGGLSETMNLMPLCSKCHQEYTNWFMKNKKQMLLLLIQLNYNFIENIVKEWEIYEE